MTKEKEERCGKCGLPKRDWRHNAGPYSDEESHPFAPPSPSERDGAQMAQEVLDGISRTLTEAFAAPPEPVGEDDEDDDPHGGRTWLTELWAGLHNVQIEIDGPSPDMEHIREGVTDAMRILDALIDGKDPDESGSTPSAAVPVEKTRTQCLADCPCCNWSLAFNCYSAGYADALKFGRPESDEAHIDRVSKFADDLFPHETCDNGDAHHGTQSPPIPVPSTPDGPREKAIAEAHAALDRLIEGSTHTRFTNGPTYRSADWASLHAAMRAAMIEHAAARAFEEAQ